MKLVFSSIKCETIFEPEFQNLAPNEGTIEFKRMRAPGGLAVVYAPNGTGKSSLARVLGAESTSESLSFVVNDDSGAIITPETGAFHVIPDQIDRNVIRGKETDYLIGKQIRREYELKDSINTLFESAYFALGKKYKSDYKVSKVGDYLLMQIGTLEQDSYQKAYGFIRTIVNKQAHSTDIDISDFLEFVRNEKNKKVITDLDDEKKKYVIDDVSHRKSIVRKLIELDSNSVIANTEIMKIEQHDDAIGILKKYHEVDSCIVCDNHNFDRNALLRRKTDNRKRIYDGLDPLTKDLLDGVVRDNTLTASDPFDIKGIVARFISDGKQTALCQLQNELKKYVHAIGDEMINAMLGCFDGTRMLRDYDEYSRLVITQPQLDSEELLFIEDVINESIGKDITIERDPDSKNYKLKIGDKDLIGTDRESMELSTGEQNFISLAFELLLARHSAKEYVILDDPISSFDSVYKNKIAFCIIKFLEKKKQLVLTHNTDLVRLLDVQLNNCFNLYILNNVEDGKNGFIPVSEKEKKLLINLHELVKLFQNQDNALVPTIKNRRQFLMSMVPFMRGYAHISFDPGDIYGTLSGIMHGYGTGSIDVIPIYKQLFGYDFADTENISVGDVLGVDCNTLDILDKNQLPLLSDTLEQSLIYYHLRMKVEKELVDAFNINVREMDMLNQIIQKAFFCKETDVDFEQKRNFRVYFTSRKTLLNEFNHFEGNMNIFQPAIDIKRSALQREIVGIEAKLAEVKAFANGMKSLRSIRLTNGSEI